MDIFSQHIWQRFRRSLIGRFFAAAVIAAPFGAFAAVEVSPTPLAIVLSTIGAALLGILAVGLLELRDRHRAQTAGWQQRVTRTTEQIREFHPEISPAHTPAVAKAVEESRFTPLVWAGIVLGCFCALCGVAMIITRVIQFFRAG
jgi:hypothetical protein